MKKHIDTIRISTALGMLIAGVTLSFIGFWVSPVGEISDSVLWYFAQCLIYAGSAFGMDFFIDKKIESRDQARANKRD